jgi:hypothetical protein
MSTVPRTPQSRTPGAKSTPPAINQPASNQNGASRCAHGRVQIVSREEDAEYVECLDCREIFEASEFKDMAIEEKIEGAEEE